MADTARSRAALKAFFETGDIPTQQQFADFIESYANLVDDNSLDGLQTALLAVYPSSQSTAAQITKFYTRVTGPGTNPAAVKLPVMTVGKWGILINATTGALNVYPATGEGIKNAGANLPWLMANGSTVLYVCNENGTTSMFPYTERALNCLSYRATLTQTGTGAPVATIIENTFGATLALNYDSPGIYYFTLSGVFTANKTFVLIGQPATDTASEVQAGRSGSNQVIVESYDDTGTLADNILSETAILIQVYP